MTTASKIHRRDPGAKKGVAVCGRKADGPRITDDPDAVTCGVCATFAPEPRAARTKTVVDRLAEAPLAALPDLTSSSLDELARARARSHARACARLAGIYPDQFRDFYRAELAEAIAELDVEVLGA